MAGVWGKGRRGWLPLVYVGGVGSRRVLVWMVIGVLSTMYAAICSLFFAGNDGEGTEEVELESRYGYKPSLVTWWSALVDKRRNC